MLKILVVEDEQVVALDIQTRLRSLGYEVPAFVASGEAAIENAGRIRPDLVLMDIHIAGKIDGIEAAERIRTRFHIPVVYLTAYADERTLQRGVAAAPYGYIMKPFGDSDLRTAIETAVHRHSMEQQLRQRERWFTTTLRSIGDAVIVTDVQGSITFLNPAAEALTGWPNQEALGQESATVFSLVEERTHAPLEDLAIAMRAHETVGLADRALLVARDGNMIPIEHSVASIRDDQGETLGAVLVFREITERTQAEAERQSRARQWEALTQLSADLTATLDETEICQRVVRGLHEKLGYDYLGLFLVDDSTADRVLRASIGWPGAPPGLRLPAGIGLSERPLLDGQLHYTPDVNQDPRYVPGIDGRSEVDVPLRVDDKVLGVLVVESSQVDDFDQHDFLVLNTAANQAAVALERAREHQAVREAEIRYRSLFDRTPAELYRTTPEGQFLEANPALVGMLGYPDRETLLAANARDLYVDPQDRQRWRTRLEQEELVRDYEVAMRTYDGTIIWARDNSRAVRGKEGEVLYYEGNLEDITERKRAEEALSESESKYRTLFEASTDAIFLETLDGRILDCNSTACGMLGYAKEELVKLRVTDLIPEDALVRLPGMPGELGLAPADLLPVGGTASLPEGVYDHLAESGLFFETVNQRKDGQTIPVEVSARLVAVGEDERVIAFVRDITDRRQADSALRHRAEELEALQATVLDIIVPHDLPTLLQTIVERATRLLDAPMGGLYLCEPDQEQVRCVVSHNTPGDYRGTVLRHGEGAAGVVAHTGRPLVIDDYGTWDGRAQVFEEDQPFRAVLAVPMIWQDQVIGVIDVVHPAQDRVFDQADLELLTLLANHAAIAVENARLYEQLQRELAERKRLEQQSEERRLYLENLLACAPDAIVTLDAQHRILEWNQGAEQLFGYAAQEVTGLDIDAMIAASDAVMFEEAVRFTQQALSGKIVPPVETVRYRKDGTPVNVIVAGSPIFVGEELVGTVAVYTNITQRKRAEEEIRQLKEFNEGIVHNMTDGIVVQDAMGCFTFVNPAAAALLGYEPDELLDQHWTLAVPLDQQPVIRDADERRSRGEADRYEVEVLGKDGSRIPVLISGSPRFDPDTGDFAGTLAVFTDISERVMAEEELARHAEQMEALYETALEINNQPDLSALLHAIVQRAAGLLGARMGGLYLVRPGDEDLELVINHNLPGDYAGTRLRLGEGLSGRVAQTGEPLMVPDYSQWEGRATVFADGLVHRVLAVPLKLGERVIGVINVTDDAQTGPFDADEVRLVSLFADQAAIAVENARLLEAEASRRREAETLQAATQALTATLDLPEVFRLILQELRQVVPYDSASVQQLRGDWLEIIGQHGFPNPEEILGIRFHLRARDNPNRKVVRTRAPVILKDAPAEYAEFQRDPHAPAGIRSWLGVPLLFGDRLIGMLALDKREPSFYTEDHARLVMAFAAQAAIAVDNARLFQAEREQRELAERLRETALLVSSSLDLQEVLELILDQLARVLPYDSGSIQILEPDASRVLAARNLPPGEVGRRYLLDRHPYNRHLARAGQPIIIRDLQEDDHGWLPAAGLERVRANIGIPLRVREQVIGLLTVDSHQPGAYGEADAAVVQLFAQQAAIAIENARLHSETQRRLQEQIALREAGAVISSALDSRTVLARITEQMAQAVDATSAYISSFDSEERMATVIAEYIGPDACQAERESDLGEAYPEGGRLEWLAMMHAGQHDVSHVDSPELDPTERAHMEQYGARTILYIPLRARERLLGYIELWESRRRRDFSPEEIALCQDIAQQAAIALENARLYEQAQQEIAERKRGEEVIHQRNRELALLNRVIAASAASSSPETILGTVCRELALAFDVPQSAAALLNGEKTEATVVAEYLAEGRPPALGEIIPVEGNPSMHYLLEQKAPLVVADAQTDPLVAPIQDIERRRGTVSLLLVPLVVEEEVVGSLGVDAIESRTFTAEEVELAWRAADQVSSALARARLEETRRRLSAAVEQAADAVIITDTDGVILYVNPALERVAGYRQAELIGQEPGVLQDTPLDRAFHQDLWRTVTAGEVWQERLDHVRVDGTLYTLDMTVSPVRNQAGEIVNYVGTMRDVTREVQLEMQFQQAQKMEALGRLAGGIAHDFNNLLTVIRLSIRLLDQQLHSEDPLWEHVRRLEETSERAIKLTKQLLSFSRREIIEPQVLDLNELVRDLDRMLQRIIGEDIELVTTLKEDLRPVEVDPSQMEQVIMNLVINARDAMPAGGTLTIETANVLLDEAYAAAHVDVQAGEHVLLSIQDTGMGMDSVVKAHLFEPFFTTKEPGQGTGLGLPTVFGIVKQNEGHVQVDSEPGQGTIFRIYLPCTRQGAAPDPLDLPASMRSPIRGTETVLVVEDEPTVQDLAVRVLMSCGYQVLAAADGHQALEISQQHHGPIHLLLTDVILPRMTGKEIADRLQGQRPEIRVLYMSGYTDDVITDHGVLAPGTAFLPKPFTLEHLTAKIRSVLDSVE